MKKIYVIFFEIYMKWISLTALKGSNSLKKRENINRNPVRNVQMMYYAGHDKFKEINTTLYKISAKLP